MDYIAKQFSNIANTPFGKNVWRFLNKKGNIIRLETASQLNKPAAEAVSIQLLNEFGEKVRDDRVKQMIGHMIRQIMESKNYSLSTQGAKVRTGGLFSKASKYKK